MKSKLLKQIAEKNESTLILHDAKVGGHGTLCSRPLSNNGIVEYDGNSWFITYVQSNKVKQIETNPSISLSF